MIGFEEAVALVAEIAKPLRKESIAIDQASGRFLAEPVIAKVTAPAKDVSAMDGYAIRGEDIAEIPKAFSVIGESFAGSGYVGTVEPD